MVNKREFNKAKKLGIFRKGVGYKSWQKACHPKPPKYKKNRRYYPK